MDPISIEHFRRSRTILSLRVKSGGDKLDLTGKTVFAGIESMKGTAANTTCFKRFTCTPHGTSGTLSATIPATGLSFTGAATLRVWASGSPKQFLGRPIPVVVRDLSANWLA